MPSSDHSDHGTTFKGTNKDNKDKFSLQSATDVAVDPPQKHSRSLSVESTVNRAVKPAVEATLNEADYYASSPPAKRLKFHDNNAITVYVGPEKAAFTIHRGPICEASAYFKALFDGTFKETSEKVVTLLEHTPETFDQFLGFAYAKNLDRTTFQALDEEARWMAYSKLYVLADYLDSQTLKATVVGILFARIGSARVLKKSACITAQVIGYIYENTLRNCGLRKLIVAQHIWGSDDEPFRKTEAVNDLDTFLADLDEEFVAELASKSMRRVWDKKTRDPFKGNAAQFYDTDKPGRNKQTAG